MRLTCKVKCDCNFWMIFASSCRCTFPPFQFPSLTTFACLDSYAPLSFNTDLASHYRPSKDISHVDYRKSVHLQEEAKIVQKLQSHFTLQVSLMRLYNLIFLNTCLSVPDVMFCKQCLAYAVHIDWCYHATQNIHVGLNIYLC